MKYITENRLRIVSCILFLFIGLLLIPIYRYQINPDGIAYLGIAKHYGNGRWMDALNSCWPPLYSWIIAPWVLFIDEPLWVAKVYNVISGVGCLWVSQKIMQHLKVSLPLQVLGVILLFGTYLMWAFNLATPDLLSVWIILVYSYYIVTGKFLQHPVLIGLIGALAYFTKSYCFFFFAAHLSFHYIYYAFLKKAAYTILIKRYVISMFFFLLISCTWMFLLYQKYEVFNISSASAWTHGMLKYPNLDCVNQFIPPPHPESVFAWEDPPRVCPHRDWNIFASSENLRLQADVIIGNTIWFFKLQKLTGYFHLLAFAVILFSILFAYENKHWRIKRPMEILSDPLFILFPLIIIYTFGYLLIFIEPRYVWMGYALITIGAFAALSRPMGTFRLKGNMGIILSVLLLVGLLIISIFNDSKMLIPLKILTGDKTVTYNGKEFYERTQQLLKESEPGTRMAGWGQLSRIDRTQSWTLAYYADWRYYGQLPTDATNARQLIEKYNIRIITTAEGDSLPSFLKDNWKRIEPAPGNLSVFKQQ